MVARHFCNKLILRDCEERLFHFDVIRILYVSFDAIRILYALCNMLISCFMRYACFMLYAIRLFHALCEKSVLCEGLGPGTYIEGSAFVKSSVSQLFTG